MEPEASPPILRREGFSLEPLFSLLFFCALGVFIGLLAHWVDRARIWPWMPVYVFSGALGALVGGMLVHDWLMRRMAFRARTLFAVLLSMLFSLAARRFYKRNTR